MNCCPKLDQLRGGFWVLCVGVVAIICTTQAAAQPSASYAQRQWTTEEGLPVNTVRDLAEGPQGYLWMATYAGLVRFDGVAFSAMTAANSDLPTSRLQVVRRGPEGHLWVRTDGSQFVEVDPRRRAVRGVYGNGAGGMPSFANEWAAGPDSTLWLGTSSMLYRRPPGGEAWEEAVPHPIDVVALEETPVGGVWMGTVEQRVWRVTRDSVWQVAAHTPTGERPSGLTALAGGPLGVWAGGEEGVFRVGEGRLIPLPAASPPRIASPLVLNALPDSSLWVYTRDATLYRVRRPRTRDPTVQRIGSLPVGADRSVRMGPEGRRWRLLENRVEVADRPVLQTERSIQALLRDREGNWWVGTAGDGLYRLRRTRIRMVGSDDGLPAENVYGIAAGRTDSSSVWVGSIGGSLTRIRTEGDSSPTVTPLQAAWGLPPIVWTAHEDRSGTLWIGTEEGLYPRRDGRTTQAGLPPLLQNRTIRAVYEDRSGRLWVLFGGTLHVRSDGTWHRLPQSRAFPRAQSGPDGRVITQTQNGSIWIGTDGAGLLRVRRDSLRRFQIGRVRTDGGLPSGRIRSIHEDSTGDLWVGTGDGGLAHIGRQGTLRLADDSITAITRADGLPGNTISQILADGLGRLWMSTNRGIFRIEQQELIAFVRGEIDRVDPVVYTERHGLASREANGGVHSAGTRTPDGRLWFPTQKGVAVIDPSGTQPVPPPPAAIETITAMDTAYQAAPGDTLRLDSQQRTFTVEYTGLHFADPAATRFEIRLAGFDRRPIRTARRSVQYTEVDPGTYELVVRASAERDAWGEPARMTVTVAPFWWETGWFYVLCAFALIGMGIAGYRWRTRRLRKRQEQLEATVAERTEVVRRKNEQLAEQAERLQELDAAKDRFFANVSHEFRTPLTLIRGPVRKVRRSLDDETLAEEAEQLEIAERNTARLQRLVNQLLGLARLDAGSYRLNARPTKVGAEAERFASEFEPLAEREGLSLTVETETRLDDAAPVYADPEALGHVLSNLLSNAIKFTPEGGRVAVRTRETPEAAVIEVQDTGPGIPEAEQDAVFDRFAQTGNTAAQEQEGAGIGLAFVQDLVELHGGFITVESTEGDGTTFTVRLPRGNDHLSDDQLAAAYSEPADGVPTTSASSSDTRSSNLESPRSPLDPQFSSHDEKAPTQEVDPTGSDDSAQAHGKFENRKSKMVLVVDDNADVRRFVRQILEPEFEVLEAADGEEGLRAARKQLPDVILADVMMPAMDGREMTRRLKTAPETEAIPVIMVTARAEVEDEVQGLRQGADDYVTKPFDAAVLHQRVEGVVALQQRLRRRIRAEVKGDPEADEKAPDESSIRSEVEQEARAAIREHLTDPDFGVNELAERMAVSRSTLYRTLTEEADRTPSTLIAEVRMETACSLLEADEPVTQVAYAVGYETLAAFSSAFDEHVGTAPSRYAASHS